MRGRLLAVASITAAIGMANAASASAAALYVDDSGDDVGGANACTVPADPCLTIEQAHDQLGTENVIHLGGGTYPELVFVNEGDSLIEDSAFSPAAAGQAMISPSSTTVPAVQMSTTGTVSGLTISSPFTAVFIDSSGTLSNNLFAFGNVPSGQYNADVVVGGFTGAAPTITGNTFVDPSPENVFPGQFGLVLNSTGSPTVSGNSFEGFQNAIFALSSGGATPTITGNEITGTHDTTIRGAGILVFDGALATLSGNNIHSPGTGVPYGVEVFQNTAGNQSGATMRRNRIIGHEIGVNAQGNEAPVTLSSDLIAKANGSGLVFQQVSGHGIGGSATNVTVVDTVTASDVLVADGTTLTLDSSIVGAGNAPSGIDSQGSGACSISFSRGTGDSNGGCGTGFTTTADPMFVNPAADNYHLGSLSPMINAGNPAAPALGDLDIDGEPRMTTFTIACGGGVGGRREIGADETKFDPVPPAIPCTPPTPPKKCKKGQKRKQGKCVKKKRKKKRKK